MRASTTSCRLTSTSAEPRQSWLSVSVSSVRLLQTVACSTGCRPPNLTPDEPEPRFAKRLTSLKSSDDGHKGIDSAELYLQHPAQRCGRAEKLSIYSALHGACR